MGDDKADIGTVNLNLLMLHTLQ